MNHQCVTPDCFAQGGMDLTKASGIVDALDDKEYTGSLVTLLQDPERNSLEITQRRHGGRLGDGRIEMPDYPERAVLEGVVNASDSSKLYGDRQ